MTMTVKYKKKLIEVAIPLESINKASAREKSIRHGHPSTLHLWWARRPLATCRAILFCQLVDDPSSYPDMFPTEEAQEKERERLFKIVEDLVIWENSTNEEILERARAEIRRSCDGDLPPVYDPFSGGGSIPMEAQRLGLPAYGSDLNPIAVMIGKAAIEIPSIFKNQPPIHPGIKDSNIYRNAEGLSEEVKYYGNWMRDKAFERIGHLFPEVDLPIEYGGGKSKVVAWIWTRTVPSPDPAFLGIHVPIASSFVLSSKKEKEVWLEPIVDKVAKTYRFQVCHGSNGDALNIAKKGAKEGRGANFRCILSGTAITPDFVKKSGKQGDMSERLMAVIVEGKKGRLYLPAKDEYETLAHSEIPTWKPTTLIANNSRDFRTQLYGMETFGDLFTDRQLIALNTFSDLVREAQAQIEKDALAAGMANDGTSICDGGNSAKAYAEAVAVYLAFAVDRLAPGRLPDLFVSRLHGKHCR